MISKIGPSYRVQFRRKREAKTNYYLRRKLLESNAPRLVIRLSYQHVIAQVISAHIDGDRTLATATSTHLVRDFNWKAGTRNLSAAYLTGLLVGINSQQKDYKQANLDIGFQSVVYGNRIFAALKGAIDSGMQIAHNDIVFPNEDRIRGEHIAKYSEYLNKLAKENDVQPTNQFSNYIKRGLRPEDVPNHFDQIREQIIKLKK